MATHTKEPVTVGGWYENVDGSWTQYWWSPSGQLQHGLPQPAPETRDEREARYERETRESRGEG